MLIPVVLWMRFTAIGFRLPASCTMNTVGQQDAVGYPDCKQLGRVSGLENPPHISRCSTHHPHVATLATGSSRWLWCIVWIGQAGLFLLSRGR